MGGEMNDKNLILSKNNCFEYTISLVLISVPTVLRDFNDMIFLTLEISFYILQLQHKELKKKKNLKLCIRFCCIFKIWGMEGEANGNSK